MQKTKLTGLIIVLSALLAHFGALAQQPFYTFTQTTAPYTEISGGTVVTTTFTQQAYYANLPVSLTLFDEHVGNLITMGPNGFVVATGTNYAFATDPFNTALSPLDNTSSLKVGAETTATDTVVILQWKNMEADSSNPGDYINMQCKLYKNSQTVEFHYGPSLITSSKLQDTSLQILAGVFLLSKDFQTVYEMYQLHGNCSNPLVAGSATAPLSLQGFPANGTVYRFSRNSAVSVPGFEPKSYSIYPNPATDMVQLTFPAGENPLVRVTNMAGQVQGGIGYTNNFLDISGLAAGIYFITIEGAAGKSTHKLIKQ